MEIGLNVRNEILIYETFDTKCDLVSETIERKLDMGPFGAYQVPEETYVDADFDIRFTDNNEVVEKGNLLNHSMISVSIMDLVHGYTPTYNDEQPKKRRKINSKNQNRVN